LGALFQGNDLFLSFPTEKKENPAPKNLAEKKKKTANFPEKKKKKKNKQKIDLLEAEKAPAFCPLKKGKGGQLARKIIRGGEENNAGSRTKKPLY